MTHPEVSVCVPTYRRPDRLERLLSRLAALEVPEGAFEVVVVDDGSPDQQRVREVLESGRELLASRGVVLRYELCPVNRGPAAARNVAWRMAKGRFIAFTDDDCMPERGWLVALLEACARTPAAVVVGRTRPDPARAHLLSEPYARSLEVGDMTGYYHTCNILYERALLEQLGGFDEGFRLIGDDTDLGWRASEAGAEVVFSDEALVTHDVVVGTWISDLKSRKRWADVVRVIAKHPRARCLAWKPYIYRHTHVPVLFLAAISPLVLSGRRGRMVFGALVVALALADATRAGSPRRAIAKLGLRVADAYEVALVISASSRERVLVL